MVPKISVLMSVYNGEKYLKESIESILNQTFESFEFIIIDDCSTDNSARIIESFKDERIVYIKNDENIGLTKSLNKALEAAQGVYIARMDGDDISEPERFEKQYEYMSKHKQLVVLGTFGYLIDEKGEVKTEIKAPTKFPEILSDIFFQNTFIHSSTLIRADFLKGLGGYNEEFKKSQDYDLWMRVIERGGVMENLPEFLIKYRTHNESISISTSKQQEGFVILALQRGLKNILGINVSENTIRATRFIKFYQKKLNSLFLFIDSVYLCEKIKRGLIRLYPQYPQIEVTIDGIIEQVFKTQSLNPLIERFVRFFM